MGKTLHGEVCRYSGRQMASTQTWFLSWTSLTLHEGQDIWRCWLLLLVYIYNNILLITSELVEIYPMCFFQKQGYSQPVTLFFINRWALIAAYFFLELTLMYILIWFNIYYCFQLIKWSPPYLNSKVIIFLYLTAVANTHLDFSLLILIMNVVDYKKVSRLQLGKYIQVRQEDEPCNTIDSDRTVWEIVLGTQYNPRGDYFFEILPIGKRLRR